MTGQRKLSVLIATCGKRINNVPQMLLKLRADVAYIICWQKNGEIMPAPQTANLLKRDDVGLYEFDDIGLSKNRNHCLKRCNTPFALIADDDVRFMASSFDSIIGSFENNPDTDVACFKALKKDDTPLKDYPEAGFTYPRMPRGMYFNSIEIAIRMSPSLPAFNEHFGIGANYLGCGEEEIFIHDCHNHGLRIDYFPTTVCKTLTLQTSGSHFFEDARIRRAKGAVLCKIHGAFGATARCLSYALTKCKGKRLRCLGDMLSGVLYVISKRC